MTAGRICARCHRPLGRHFETVIPDSASGARPDVHRHYPSDPACRPITAAEREGRTR